MTPENTDKYYRALEICLKRYDQMATNIGRRDLIEFINEFYLAIRNKAPLPKLNRWLGYIQGALIAADATNVELERNLTRPLFRPLDFPEDHTEAVKPSLPTVEERIAAASPSGRPEWESLEHTFTDLFIARQKAQANIPAEGAKLNYGSNMMSHLYNTEKVARKNLNDWIDKRRNNPEKVVEPVQAVKSSEAVDIFDIFRKNCVHYAGNYEVTPGQAVTIARLLTQAKPHDWPVTSARQEWSGAAYQVQLPNGKWWPAPNADNFHEARDHAKEFYSTLPDYEKRK